MGAAALALDAAIDGVALDCCAIFSCRVEMSLRLDVLIIFPSRSS